MKAPRTLVVEDDAVIGGLLAETLEGLGHAVCAVETNVAKAVAAASHWRPDLMIVDVGLGEASGIRRSRRFFETDLSRMCSSPAMHCAAFRWTRTPSSFGSPSVCRTWLKRFRGRSQRWRPATVAQSDEENRALI